MTIIRNQNRCQQAEPLCGTASSFIPPFLSGAPGGLAPSAIATYVKDEKGWTVIPLRITGTTDKPSLGLNKEKAIKGEEKGIKREFQKGLYMAFSENSGTERAVRPFA
jgi:hypothetical protein